ncbi:unnamed protein product [Symbiodinium necroappetens]|uniref:Uncharacterized protein n=1 Tax=Symbiodinium necroappetens TaxID=1628268 RepID=A0A812KJM7_9DINO|nr:unnamed protein product [Symbiodinium necroappetens]
MKTTIKAVSAATLCATLGLWAHVTADDVDECTGTCSRMRITNLHYKCNDPGAVCNAADDCKCRDVTDGFWSDCYCLPANVTRECNNGCGGGWVVKNTANKAFEPGDEIKFEFVAADLNYLISFDFGDIGEDGFLERSDRLDDDPGAIRGGFSILIGEDLGGVARATMRSADFIVNCPLPIFESQSFDNAVRSDGRNEEVTGFYNFETNEFSWDRHLTLHLKSTLFTDGVDLKVRPDMTPLRDGYHHLHVSTYVTRPDYLACGVSDVANPMGVLDFRDISMFLSAYTEEAEMADIAEPFGTVDERDMNTFIKDFRSGCPHPVEPQ